jgi:hypothetical protein
MLAALSPTGVHTRLLSLENNIPSTHCSAVNKQQSLSQKWFRCKPSVCSMKLSSLVEVLDKLKKQTIEIHMVIKVQ